jgi:hypothetical protein
VHWPFPPWRAQEAGPRLEWSVIGRFLLCLPGVPLFCHKLLPLSMNETCGYEGTSLQWLSYPSVNLELIKTEMTLGGPDLIRWVFKEGQRVSCWPPKGQPCCELSLGTLISTAARTSVHWIRRMLWATIKCDPGWHLDFSLEDPKQRAQKMCLRQPPKLKQSHSLCLSFRSFAMQPPKTNSWGNGGGEVQKSKGPWAASSAFEQVSPSFS